MEFSLKLFILDLIRIFNANLRLQYNLNKNYFTYIFYIFLYFFGIYILGLLLSLS